MIGPTLQVVSSALIVLYVLLLGRKDKRGLPLSIVANVIFLISALWTQQGALIPLPVVLMGISAWNWKNWDKR